MVGYLVQGAHMLTLREKNAEWWQTYHQGYLCEGDIMGWHHLNVDFVIKV